MSKIFLQTRFKCNAIHTVHKVNRQQVAMSYNCTSVFPSIRSFPQNLLTTLRATNTCIAIINILGNAFVIYALIKTSQTTSLSIQLIVLMSSSDCINGIVALVFTNMLLWKRYDSYCTLKVITQFMHGLFINFSCTTVLLIAIDRFLHVKYLQRYSRIVTKRKGHILVSVIFLFQILLAIASSVPVSKGSTNIGELVNANCGMLGVIAVIFFYCKTTQAVKNRVSSMHNSVMNITMVRIKTFANVALSISICTGVLLALYATGFIILKMQVKGSYQAHKATELAIFRWFVYVVSLAYGVCSCVIFIAQNKPVKRLIKRMIVHGQS